MMKRCRARGKEEGGERGRDGGEGCGAGDTKETISFRSQELIKAVSLQQAREWLTSTEEGRVAWMERVLAGKQSRR